MSYKSCFLQSLAESMLMVTQKNKAHVSAHYKSTKWNSNDQTDPDDNKAKMW